MRSRLDQSLFDFILNARYISLEPLAHIMLSLLELIQRHGPVTPQIYYRKASETEGGGHA